ncbi:MAG: phytoene/squalene synthase family protein [Planctomycetota bacterium]
MTAGACSSIEASYAACRRLSRRSGSSFYPSFLLLPPPERRAMDALYAFMRYTDDLVDRDAPTDQRTTELAAWRVAVARATGAEDLVTNSDANEFVCLDSSSGSDPYTILPALADTVARYRIPTEHLMAVIDGVDMDLSPRAFETFAELERYCEKVASAVGLACIHVWGFQGPEALEPARCCGVALQMTNILRDIRSDARLGRVYLPMEDLHNCSYSVEELRSGVGDERFVRLMNLELQRTRDYYRRGESLARLLAPRGRRVFGLIMSVYRELLARIERHPTFVLDTRVALPRARKLWLAARWTWGPV